MHILVGTDGSIDARQAVEFAANLSRHLNASLRIVHVVTVDDPPQDEHNDHATIARRHAETLGVVDVHSETLAGNDVVEAILEAAGRDQADLIIVGKRGLSCLTGLILGSISQKLIATASCPVAVV